MRFYKLLLYLLFVSVFAVSGIYIFFILAGYKIASSQREILNAGSFEILRKDSILGYAPRPNAVFNHTFISTPEDSNVYTIDAFGRRITPINEDATQHALFFGCSYAFGDGITDTASIPYVFGRLKGKYQPYNYGFIGYGPQQMLSLLAKKDLTDEVSPEAGVGLFMFMNDHYNRAVNEYHCARWGFDFPCYDVADGEIVLKGTFSEVNPIHTYLWKGLAELNMLSLAPFAAPLSYVAQPSVTKEELTLKIIEASKKAYLTQFPKGKFYVVILPEESAAMKKMCEAAGIDVIDLSGINITGQNGRQEDGYHPNATGAKIIAEALAKYL